MANSWGSPPNNSSSRSSQTQPRYPLAERVIDYYPEGDHPIKRALYFFSGSCSVMIVISICLCVAATVWFIDSRLDMLIQALESSGFRQNPPVAPVGGGTPVFVVTQPAVAPPTNTPFVPPPTSTATPAPSNLPFNIGQPVIANEIGMELIVLDIQRNVQPSNFRAADKLEFAAVSVQLRNMQSNAPRSYQIANFWLRDSQGTLFTPHDEADNGRRLENGSIPPNGTIEGDLLFHIPLGEAPLTLVWQSAGSAEAYLITLQ